MHGIESMYLIHLGNRNFFLQNIDPPDSPNPPLEAHPRQPEQHQPQLPVLPLPLLQPLQPLFLKFLRLLLQLLPELLRPPARHLPSMIRQLWPWALKEKR